MIFSYKKFLTLALCLLFMFVGSIKISHAQNNQNKVTLEPSSVPTTTTCPPDKPNCYQLFGGFASLLGKGFESIDASQGLGGLMNGIIATLIKLGGVGAIIMFMVYGVQLWNANDNGEKRKSLKSKMIGTIGGFLLMLTTFIILRTINPDLLNLTPRIDFTKLEAIEQNASKTSDGTPILTGGGDPSSSNDVDRIGKNITTYDALMKKYASKYNQSCTLLKATMYRESGGNPNAQSGAGALGLMQFMPSTAQGLGYSSNDMLNPEKAIEASARYYNSLSSYGCNGRPSSNVCDASQAKYTTAAYNAGPGSNGASSACPGKTFWECTLNERGAGYKETRHYSSTVLNNIASLKEKGWGCD